MSYERDEAMRQQEGTEAMIAMREPRLRSGPRLKQPDSPSPARMWCEPGRHDKSFETIEIWVCCRCGSRGYFAGGF